MPKRSRPTKVARLIEKYALDDVAVELERDWRGEAGERRSLRELATRFNQALVQAAMMDAGLNPLDGEAANTHALLTEDSTTSGARRRAERRLEREGVDVAALRDEFVSHQAVHTYLTKVRGVDYAADRTPDVEAKVETVQRLVGRTRSVSETVVEGLRKTDAVSVGEYDVSAEVRLTCRDCNSQYDLPTFLREGGCNCAT